MTVMMFGVVMYGAVMQTNTMVLQLVILLGTGLFLGWAVTAMVANYRRLERVKAFAERVGAGDLSVLTGIAGEEDELARVGKSLDRAVGQLGTKVGTVTHGSGQLVLECSELAAISPRMSGLSFGLNQSWRTTMANTAVLQESTTTIRTQVETFNRHIQTVNAVTRETSQQIGTIIDSTEEMSVTIADIAANAERARTVAGTAVANVNAASNRVDELGSAALEISKVTDVIVEIAEQTKLLALNATIEAARAGEAGKGFAVVANEVKELALQTNNAIAEIRNKVEAMQHSTDNTITEIGAINQTIKAVNEIVVSIAGAVEEQSVTTKDIVAKLNQGESGIRSISDTLSETATEVLDMTVKISAVAEASTTLAQEMIAVHQQGVELANTIEAAAERTASMVKRGDGVLAAAGKIKTA